MSKTKTPENVQTWKISEIIGFEVFNNISGNYLGVLFNVVVTGSNDVWTVKNESGQFSIPALKSIVKEVDAIKKQIFVSLPKEYEMFFEHTKAIKDTGNTCLIYED
ncbi:MAG: PRC-barrel domain-containing protein [Elusimicrobiota bacterium]|nr:PRC-barrel domain-containing protein [Elusimicrobiota bacterium]